MMETSEEKFEAAVEQSLRDHPNITECLRKAERPTPGLLMSMAMRYDHAIGMPGFYDWEHPGIPQTGKPVPGGHARQLEIVLGMMEQLWEEVTGNGFYSPEKEERYAATREALLKKK